MGLLKIGGRSWSRGWNNLVLGIEWIDLLFIRSTFIVTIPRTFSMIADHYDDDRPCVDPNTVSISFVDQFQYPRSTRWLWTKMLSSNRLIRSRNPDRLQDWSEMAMLEMDVAIVGGGMGGLALAVGLQNRGIQAHVFEKSPKERKHFGTGMTIGQNGKFRNIEWKFHSLVKFSALDPLLPPCASWWFACNPWFLSCILINVDAMNALLDSDYGRLEWQRTNSEENRKSHPISKLTTWVGFYTILIALFNSRSLLSLYHV